MVFSAGGLLQPLAAGCGTAAASGERVCGTDSLSPLTPSLPTRHFVLAARFPDAHMRGDASVRQSLNPCQAPPARLRPRPSVPIDPSMIPCPGPGFRPRITSARDVALLTLAYWCGLLPLLPTRWLPDAAVVGVVSPEA